MNMIEYLEFLHLNHFKIIHYIRKLESEKEDSLYYVEEAMEDSQSLIEQINGLTYKYQLDLGYSKIAESLFDKISDVYEEYKQKSYKILGFRDYGWDY